MLTQIHNDDLTYGIILISQVSIQETYYQRYRKYAVCRL